jgi:hypothetical protein
MTPRLGVQRRDPGKIRDGRPDTGKEGGEKGKESLSGKGKPGSGAGAEDGGGQGEPGARRWRSSSKGQEGPPDPPVDPGSGRRGGTSAKTAGDPGTQEQMTMTLRGECSGPKEAGIAISS